VGLSGRGGVGWGGVGGGCGEYPVCLSGGTVQGAACVFLLACACATTIILHCLPRRRRRAAGVSKSELLDREAGDLAVRMALGETQVIAETKRALGEAGACLPNCLHSSKFLHAALQLCAVLSVLMCRCAGAEKWEEPASSAVHARNLPILTRLPVPLPLLQAPTSARSRQQRQRGARRLPPKRCLAVTAC
jgi:hypothetical protein